MEVRVTDGKLREGDVLARLDIGQKRLRGLRREVLTEGEHFGRDALGYWFTTEAVAIMQARMARGTPAALPLAEGAATPVAEAPVGERESLRITRVWPQRDRMVLCQRENGLEVVCRVQNAANMTPGMLLPDCRKGEYQIWYYTGRLPRRKGRL